MSDQPYRTTRTDANGRLVSADVPTTWEAGEAVLSDTAGIWISGPGTHLRSMPCIVCGYVLAGRPWTLHFITWGTKCPNNTPHLLSIAVTRHNDCPRPSNADLYNMVCDRCSDCLG